jgi:xanthine dehydrogenase molybdopterin-binding subunit B
MVLYASTQNANKTQKHAAAVLDMPENKVSCSLRRIGGGFGGKVPLFILLFLLIVNFFNY